jgi:GT2 family glycosyltransferase
MNISVLVGCLDNLDYTQHFYKTFRSVYPTEELVFVSYGSTDGTGIWLNLIESIDKNVIIYWENKRKTFSDTYNKAIEIATNDYVVFAHNDMVVAPGWLENIEKHAHKDRVISYTTIEPPIFESHSRPGKIIQNLGEDISSFNISDFHSFTSETKIKYRDSTQEGITFFMCLSRQVLLDIGGFDNIFNPYFSEDDDLIRRLKLKGLNYFTSLDSIVYHFVSKTSRFSEEAKTKTAEIEQNSNRTYIRKWGSYNSNFKFNHGFIIKNADYNIIHHFEPWCDRLYSDYSDFQKYIQNNQEKTSFNLEHRVYSLNNDPELENDIIISFDGSKLNQNSFELIQNIQNILGEVTETGEYEIDIFKIKINRLQNYIDSNIYIK